MREELYVYYKIAESDVDAARALVSIGPGVRLLRRCDTGAGPQTWMEIHDGPDPVLTEQALAAALQPFVVGSRHVERFVPLAFTSP